MGITSDQGEGNGGFLQTNGLVSFSINACHSLAHNREPLDAQQGEAGGEEATAFPQTVRCQAETACSAKFGLVS